jgi:vancomycin resistance protein YoaR
VQNAYNNAVKNVKYLAVKLTLVYILTVLSFLTIFTGIKGYAMPFYDLKPKFLTERAVFSTSYETSSSERKHNIALASKSLNNTIVDVGAEFSFNMTVGARTEKRGYKTAKIISGGEFVDGVGGGVCQVSTTLYNAVVRAGLMVTEYHPHSLQVSYVLPSTDAMVNSGSADLRFVNNTNNPIIIKTTATNTTITIKIVGEPLQVE